MLFRSFFALHRMSASDGMSIIGHRFREKLADGARAAHGMAGPASTGALAGPKGGAMPQPQPTSAGIRGVSRRMLLAGQLRNHSVSQGPAPTDHTEC